MEEADKKNCPLCGRELAEPCNLHHLLPLSQGGKGTETVMLHNICHSKIHSLFTESELARHYNTIEKLRANEDIQTFIKWVSKQPPQFYDRNDKANRKKR